MTQVVSLYNASYEKIFEIDWKKAVLLFISGKAIAKWSSEDPQNLVTTEENTVTTEDLFIPISTPSGIFKLPKDIILKKYVYIPYRDFSPTRKNIMRRDNNCCQYCGCQLNGEIATIDHVLPRSRGGKHRWENVVACCLKCNRKKGDRTPSEAKMPLLSSPKPLRFCNA
jgi:hypothetical protein